MKSVDGERLCPFVVEQTDIFVGDCFYFTHRFVRGSLHVHLASAGQDAFDGDNAEAAFFVNHQHISADQLFQLRIGLPSRRDACAAIVLKVGD